MGRNRQGMSQGEAGRKGSETTAGRQNMGDTGTQGGEATAHKYGQEFYEEIGSKGGEAQPREAKAEGGRNSVGSSQQDDQ